MIKNLKVHFIGENLTFTTFFSENSSEFVEWSKLKTVLDPNKAKKI